MNPERWKELDRLLEDAMEQPPEERAAFLEKACAGDVELRREVEAILDAYQKGGAMLDTPAVQHAAKQMAAEESASPSLSLAGRTLSHYEVISMIGAGGMGEVYLAKDRTLKRDVALKVLAPHLAQNKDALARFEREAKAIAALSHPNVCVILEFGESDGVHFIAMEYLDGQTLEKRIASGSLKTVEILDIAIQVADALDAAHGLGITHRDIKPSNILILQRGQVKVLDFGVARVTPAPGQTSNLTFSGSPATATGVMVGTVQYMSPEQALGQPVDHRTDLFSFGAVLYQMITGVLPFPGTSVTDTIDHIVHAQPAAVARFNYDVPEELVRIIRKCLEKDRERRYQSSRELLIDLRNLKRDVELGRIQAPPRLLEPVHETPPAPLEVPTKASARGRSVAFLAGAIALTIVVIVWMSQTRPALTFAPRDWILITDLDNRTGDSVFDKSLDLALSISLEQSRHANVFPRSRIAAVLSRMKQDTTQSINDTLGREIAVREGIRALVVPSILGIGETYNIAVRIRDPQSGETVRTESAAARGKDQVLAALNQVAGKIRQDLGESLSQISQTSKPVPFTTSSLEALKQYSAGYQKHREANFREARTYYGNALQIDPQFTAAKASLGMIDFENFDREAGKALLNEAKQHLDGLTDKERFGIMAFYARAVENDLPKAVEIMKSATKLYPDQASTFNNLGFYQFQLGKYREAVEAYQQAIRIDPDFMLSYDILSIIYYSNLGDFDAAIALCQAQLARNATHARAFGSLGWAYIGKDNLNAAVDAFKKAIELQPDYSALRLWLGNVFRIQGQYHQAIETLLSVPQTDPAQYSAHYALGIAYQASGDRRRARESFQRFLEEVRKRLVQDPNNSGLMFEMASVLSQLGQTARGRDMLERAVKIDPSKHFEYAGVLNVLGEREEALNRLALAIKAGFRDYVAMIIEPNLHGLYDDPKFRDLIQSNLRTR